MKEVLKVLRDLTVDNIINTDTGLLVYTSLVLFGFVFIIYLIIQTKNKYNDWKQKRIRAKKRKQRMRNNQ